MLWLVLSVVPSYVFSGLGRKVVVGLTFTPNSDAMTAYKRVQVKFVTCY